MVKLLNRASVTTATVGTGTITLGAAKEGFQTFAEAGANEGDVIVYAVEDNGAWEIGEGTYSSGTLTRNVSYSSAGGSPISLSGAAEVFGTVRASDVGAAGVLQPVGQDLNTSGSVTLDADTYNLFNITPTDDVTATFSLTSQNEGKLDIVWENVSGYTLTFTDTIEWESGSAPTFSGDGEKDWLSFETANGGSKWIGSVKAQGF
jgi:hypothetical protein